MKRLMERFLAYTSEVTGVPVAWDELVLRDAPPFLRQAYELAEVAIGDQWLLAVIVREGHAIQPVAFEKHVARLRMFARRNELAEYCLVADDVPAYIRKRLIERGIPFVVPGRELYLPQIGRAVRARRQRRQAAPVSRFMPATQSVFLLALVEPDAFPARPTDIAARLRLAPMTVGRAFNDIEAAGLGRAARKGNERWLAFEKSADQLWHEAIPCLRDPVRAKRRIRLEDFPVAERVTAGETALASWTQLLPPPEPVFAVASREWQPVVGDTEEIPIAEPGTCIVQLWRYDPRTLARQGRVDRYSLWLSLENEPDERVQAVREKLMEDMAWSQD